MKSSIEMRMQEIDKILELRSRLADAQDALGINVGIEKNEKIFVYSTNEFIEMANHIGECIEQMNGSGDEITPYYFRYKGTEFWTVVIERNKEHFMEQLRHPGK